MKKHSFIEKFILYSFYLYLIFGLISAFAYLMIWYGSSYSSLALNQYILNYNSGFIRRGFLGTLVFYLSLWTHIHDMGFYFFAWFVSDFYCLYD